MTKFNRHKPCIEICDWNTTGFENVEFNRHKPCIEMQPVEPAEELPDQFNRHKPCIEILLHFPDTHIQP